MAGCLPMHFPVVLTAWMADDAGAVPDPRCHRQHRRCAILVVLNGPIRQEIGACGTFNALGNQRTARRR